MEVKLIPNHVGREWERERVYQPGDTFGEPGAIGYQCVAYECVGIDPKTDKKYQHWVPVRIQVSLSPFNLVKSKFRGSWSPDIEYEVGDAIGHPDGDGFICYHPGNKGVEPGTTAHWKFAELYRENPNVFVGGPNIIFKGGHGRGDRTPGDVGFVPQKVIPPNVFAELVVTAKPELDLTLNYLAPMHPLQLPQARTGITQIDIRRTEFYDSANPNAGVANLSSLVRGIVPATLTRNEGESEASFAARVEAAGKVLALNNTLTMSDGEHQGQFKLAQDDKSKQFAPTRAFLADDKEQQ